MKSEPCAKCGFKSGGFHICVDLSTPEPKVAPIVPRASYKPTNPKRVPGTKTTKSRPKTARIPSNRKGGPAFGYSEETRLAVIERYKTGKVSYQDVADEFDLTHTQVGHLIRKAAKEGLVEVRKAGKTVGDKVRARRKDRDDKIEARYLEGVSYKDIANEFEMHHSAVYYILKRAESEGRLEMRALGRNINRTARSRAKTKDRDEEWIRRYVVEGVGATTIARDSGVAHSTVGTVLRRAEKEGRLTVRGPGRIVKNGSNRSPLKSPGELDLLPAYSIVVSDKGQLKEKQESGLWYSFGAAFGYKSEELLGNGHSFRVLRMGNGPFSHI